MSLINEFPNLMNDNWFCLCTRPNAIDFIEKNKDNYKMDWRGLSENPEIFEINHVKTHARMMEESKLLSICFSS